MCEKSPERVGFFKKKLESLKEMAGLPLKPTEKGGWREWGGNLPFWVKKRPFGLKKQLKNCRV